MWNWLSVPKTIQSFRQRPLKVIDTKYVPYSMCNSMEKRLRENVERPSYKALTLNRMFIAAWYEVWSHKRSSACRILFNERIYASFRGKTPQYYVSVFAFSHAFASHHEIDWVRKFRLPYISGKYKQRKKRSMIQ